MPCSVARGCNSAINGARGCSLDSLDVWFMIMECSLFIGLIKWHAHRAMLFLCLGQFGFGLLVDGSITELDQCESGDGQGRKDARNEPLGRFPGGPVGVDGAADLSQAASLCLFPLWRGILRS